MKRVITALTIVVLACGVSYGQEMPSSYENLKCYDQMIGSWVYDGELLEDVPNVAKKGSKMVVHVSFKWILNKNVVEMNWSIENEGIATSSGKSLIGWDAATGRIIGRAFNSMGWHGQNTGDFESSTKTWTLNAEGVTREGKTTSSTVVITLTDADTLVRQAKDRKGGDLTGDSPKMTYKRARIIKQTGPPKQPIRLKKAK